MSFKGTAHRQKVKKYSDEDIAKMEHMIYREKKTYAEVGAIFGVKDQAIRRQLEERGSY